jgi:hypothetical protein
MRIGIHTGRVVAGIIGSKVVRYDIFGDGVLIANKMETHGIPGKVCISEETRKILSSQPDIFNEYSIEFHKLVELKAIDKKIKAYIVERKVRESTASRIEGSDGDKSLSSQNDIGNGGSIKQSSNNDQESNDNDEVKDISKRKRRIKRSLQSNKDTESEQDYDKKKRHRAQSDNNSYKDQNETESEKKNQ